MEMTILFQVKQESYTFPYTATLNKASRVVFNEMAVNISYPKGKRLSNNLIEGIQKVYRLQVNCFLSLESGLKCYVLYSQASSWIQIFRKQQGVLNDLFLAKTYRTHRCNRRVPETYYCGLRTLLLLCPKDCCSALCPPKTNEGGPWASLVHSHSFIHSHCSVNESGVILLLTIAYTIPTKTPALLKHIIGVVSYYFFTIFPLSLTKSAVQTSLRLFCFRNSWKYLLPVSVNSRQRALDLNIVLLVMSCISASLCSMRAAISRELNLNCPTSSKYLALVFKAIQCALRLLYDRNCIIWPLKTQSSVSNKAALDAMLFWLSCIISGIFGAPSLRSFRL